jgi:hypothetical protein
MLLFTPILSVSPPLSALYVLVFLSDLQFGPFQLPTSLFLFLFLSVFPLYFSTFPHVLPFIPLFYYFFQFKTYCSNISLYFLCVFLNCHHKFNHFVYFLHLYPFAFHLVICFLCAFFYISNFYFLMWWIPFFSFLIFLKSSKISFSFPLKCIYDRA